LETGKQRPTGVTIVAILIIIGGILFLLAGIGTVTIGALFFLEIMGVIFAIIGAILLAVGIGYLVVSYGLLKGREWAWTITIILLFIGIGIDIASIVFGSFAINMDIVTFLTSNGGSFVSLAITVAILYYLYRPHVKSYFGKASGAVTAA
jgi:drug/metabolite transporter (DMT)-like permease